MASITNPNTTAPTSSTGHHTHGSTNTTADPTAEGASVATKLKGDVQGAVHGTIGSLQAATGATVRNKAMEQKGLEKMSEEDDRLSAKKGSAPVGSETRDAAVGAGATNSGSATGRGTGL